MTGEFNLYPKMTKLPFPKWGCVHCNLRTLANNDYLIRTTGPKWNNNGKWKVEVIHKECGAYMSYVEYDS